MSLKRAIFAYQQAFFFPVNLPVGSRVALAEQKLADLFTQNNFTRLPVEDLQVGLLRVAEWIAQHDGIDGLARKDLKKLPWFLFEELGQGVTLADLPGVLPAWLAWFGDHPSSGTLWALLYQVLVKPLSTAQRTLLHPVIRASMAGSAHPKWQLWRERCQRFHLLELDGPDRLAARIYQGEMTFETICRDAGLQGELASGGFAQRILQSLLSVMPSYADSRTGLKLDRLKALLQGFRDQQGRFLQIIPGFQSQLAEVLLRPFIDREPEANLKNLVRDFLIKSLGDPRTHPAAWQSVDPKARQVMTLWVSGRPSRVDDKLWMFIEEANKQISGLEADFYQIKKQIAAVPSNLLAQSVQRLNAIVGVAQFFNLFEVINTCRTIESTLQRIQQPGGGQAHLVDEIFDRLAQLQSAVRDVPGFIFHGR
ncbi:hypothetical protein SIID45300_02194 [Candidatus Magnetaquicoccaceae bacterium FCR-1]|uniref:HPt domain-containing protein n=1 Tax=Candidatus Magnetaquiglobus chichijimensis TaxID=3141448 RepID=A0ABQ0CAX1_9PROT